MTKASELRELTDDILELRLAEARDELFKLRFGHATGQLDDTNRLPVVRREIARMHTLLREREIAAHEVLLERHIGREIELEAVIPQRRLAFGARQRIFLLRARMEEHRKILTDRTKALRDHLFGCSPDHHIVAILDGQSQQSIANRSPNHVDLHTTAS